MKAPIKIITYFLFVLFLISGCSEPGQSIQPDQSISDEEVVVSGKKMDAHFERVAEFADAYMIFGGDKFKQTDLNSYIWISGIPVDKAISIYKKYPDFHKCKSPSAAIAQRAVLDLKIIPADSEVLTILHNAISQFEESFKNNGDRIFVKLEGETLKMTSAIWREWNEDVMGQLPDYTTKGYYLVKSAEVIAASIVFEGY